MLINNYYIILYIYYYTYITMHAIFIYLLYKFLCTGFDSTMETFTKTHLRTNEFLSKENLKNY